MRRRTLVEATLPLDAHGACAVVESAANRTLNLVPPIMRGRDLPGWVERTMLAAVGERDAVDRIAG